MLDSRTNLRRLDAQGRREVEAELDRRDNREEQLDRFAAGGSDNEEEEDREQRPAGFPLIATTWKGTTSKTS